MPPYTTPVNSPDRDGRRPRWAKTPRTPWTPSPWMVALKQSAGDVASAVSAAFKPKPIKIESPSASPSRDIPIPSIEVDPAAWLLSHASSPGLSIDTPTHKPGRRPRLKLTWKRREAEAAAAAASAAATSAATTSAADASAAATSVAAAPAPVSGHASHYAAGQSGAPSGPAYMPGHAYAPKATNGSSYAPATGQAAIPSVPAYMPGHTYAYIATNGSSSAPATGHAAIPSVPAYLPGNASTYNAADGSFYAPGVDHAGILPTYYGPSFGLPSNVSSPELVQPASRLGSIFPTPLRRAGNVAPVAGNKRGADESFDNDDDIASQIDTEVADDAASQASTLIDDEDDGRNAVRKVDESEPPSYWQQPMEYVGLSPHGLTPQYNPPSPEYVALSNPRNKIAYPRIFPTGRTLTYSGPESWSGLPLPEVPNIEKLYPFTFQPPNGLTPRMRMQSQNNFPNLRWNGIIPRIPGRQNVPAHHSPDNTTDMVVERETDIHPATPGTVNAACLLMRLGVPHIDNNPVSNAVNVASTPSQHEAASLLMSLGVSHMDNNPVSNAVSVASTPSPHEAAKSLLPDARQAAKLLLKMKSAHTSRRTLQTKSTMIPPKTRNTSKRQKTSQKPRDAENEEVMFDAGHESDSDNESVQQLSLMQPVMKRSDRILDPKNAEHARLIATATKVGKEYYDSDADDLPGDIKGIKKSHLFRNVAWGAYATSSSNDDEFAALPEFTQFVPGRFERLPDGTVADQKAKLVIKLVDEAGKKRIFANPPPRDWQNQEALTALNKRTVQQIRRCTRVRFREAVEAYLPAERRWILANLLDGKPKDGWKAFVKAFNQQFEGKVVPGSSAPRPGRSHSSLTKEVERFAKDFYAKGCVPVVRKKEKKPKKE